jgi:predicted amidophosphoribosyltransferase
LPEVVDRTELSNLSADLTDSPSICRPRHQAWDRDGCFALDYLRSEDHFEPRRALVHAFKAGNPRAVERAALLVAGALSTRDRLRVRHEPVLLVAIPGHAATMATTPLESLCRRLQRLLPWLEHRPGALQRTLAIRQSSASSDRPSVAEHLASLRWCSTQASRRVIMIDDVFTLARTSEACRQLVIQAGAGGVLVACLAKTKL